MNLFDYLNSFDIPNYVTNFNFYTRVDTKYTWTPFSIELSQLDFEIINNCEFNIISIIL